MHKLPMTTQAWPRRAMLRHALAWPWLAPVLARAQTRVEAGPPTLTDETWTDVARQRSVPVRVRWPVDTDPMPDGGRPVVIYSHGLGGTREGASVWGEAWVAAGCVVVHLQHPGSDLAAVRAVARSFRDQAGLRKAAGPQQLLARLQDVRFALDEIGQRYASRNGRWATVRPDAAGMAGHSFGAHTTLGIAGQRYPGHPGFVEPRLTSYIAFSPTLPVAGNAAQAFERLHRPVLSLTGTRDDDVVGVGATPQQRIGVYAALPAGRKAHLVLRDADHMTFAGDPGLRAEIIERHPSSRRLQAQHHALVAAVTADWWRATLMEDSTARQRLLQPAGLTAGDLWQQG